MICNRTLTEREWEQLNRASLNRVYRKTRRAGFQSFGIISAARSDLSNAENNRRYGELERRVREMGYGFFRLRGHWQKDPSSPIESEHSLFVPGLSQKHATRLMRDFDQDAVVYSGPETKGRVAVLHKDGRVDDIGRFNPGKLVAAFSSLNRKPFAFKGFEVLPNSWMEALISSREPQICVAPGVCVCLPKTSAKSKR